MTVRASEFDALAAKVDAGELTENEVVSWMASSGWPGHSVLECWAGKAGEDHYPDASGGE